MLSGQGVVLVGPFGDEGSQGRIGREDPMVPVAVDAGWWEDRGQAVEARREREAPLREARKEAEKAEEEVHAAEEALAELRKALDDPRLYDGSADSAREAGRLNREIRKTQEALARAMARWAEAVETLEGLEGG